MKNKLLLGIMASGLIFTTTNVKALSGNATLEFESKDNVTVGETFKVKMDVKDVLGTYDGIVSLEGNLSFDENMVEYISATPVETPYKFYINENYNYKIAGLDFTLNNGILNNVTVFEFAFKALQEGNTTITLKNYKLTDSTDYVDATVIGKNIAINALAQENTIKSSNYKEENKVEATQLKEEVSEVIETSNLSMDIDDTIETQNTKKTFIEKVNAMFKMIKNTFKSILK